MVRCGDLVVALRFPWMPRCPYTTLVPRCRRRGRTLVLRGEACGERILAYLKLVGLEGPVARVVDAESDPAWLNGVLRGEVRELRPKCMGRAPRLRVERVVAPGLRGLGLVAYGEDTKYFVKVARRVEAENHEHLFIKYLSTQAPEIVPVLYCTVHVETGEPYILVTSEAEGRRAAEIYIGAARGALSREGPPARVLRYLGRLIGGAAARMHDALEHCREDWCLPEEAGRRDLEEWLNRLRIRAAMIESMGGGLASRAAEALRRLYAAFKDRLEPPSIKARIHGDLHLGQIYVAGPRVTIVDFEGEPYRYPARRGEKETGERDLACLARSIDYAAALGLGYLEDAAMLLSPPRGVAVWEQEAFQHVLEGYAAMARSPSPLLLAFWIVERASYEAIYEYRAGTGLHPIPLASLIRMAEGRDPLLSYVLGQQR